MSRTAGLWNLQDSSGAKQARVIMLGVTPGRSVQCRQLKLLAKGYVIIEVKPAQLQNSAGYRRIIFWKRQSFAVMQA